MIKIGSAVFIVLAAIACPGYGVEPSASFSATEFAESMKQARYSDGFEVRMKVTTVDSDGRRSEPIKLAIIGQITSDQERLLVSGISPDKVRNRSLAAE